MHHTTPALTQLVRLCSDVGEASPSAPGMPGRYPRPQAPGGAAFSSMLDSALPPDVMQRFLDAAHDPQDFQSFVGGLPAPACMVAWKHAMEDCGALRSGATCWPALLQVWCILHGAACGTWTFRAYRALMHRRAVGHDVEGGWCTIMQTMGQLCAHQNEGPQWQQGLSALHHAVRWAGRYIICPESGHFTGTYAP